MNKRVGFWRWLYHGIVAVVRGTPCFLRELVRDEQFLFPVTILSGMGAIMFFCLAFFLATFALLIGSAVLGLLSCYCFYQMEGAP